MVSSLACFAALPSHESITVRQPPSPAEPQPEQASRTSRPAYFASLAPAACSTKTASEAATPGRKGNASPARHVQDVRGLIRKCAQANVAVVSPWHVGGG
ncbi:hypothetical protein L227DRAFT_104978 [Lentinus tigrinus ALCF2SS1-6]|uniref:Uncharacterized protein n=1 Tax=Lentinus tigrinus ALCF2SS1-6 TaxID=1328759 RepID=A0A5C2S8I6_9APHY|nr:hypothetical protein L227DRAFT_104978 [Lentinus tigrinus ALCF2SS1-6]